MSRNDERPVDCKVYIGNLRGGDFTSLRSEIRREFSKFGRLREVWVAKSQRGFAIVHFYDPRDAKDAVRALDGSFLCGNRVNVEHGRPRRHGYHADPERDSRISPQSRYRDPFPKRRRECCNCKCGSLSRNRYVRRLSRSPPPKMQRRDRSESKGSRKSSRTPPTKQQQDDNESAKKSPPKVFEEPQQDDNETATKTSPPNDIEEPI